MKKVFIKIKYEGFTEEKIKKSKKIFEKYFFVFFVF